MPYIGIKRDNFEARCKASEQGRYLPKFDDLLRCGPYFKGSLKADATEFTRLCFSKFNQYFAEHHQLQEMLTRVHEEPYIEDLRRAILTIESRLWRNPEDPFAELVRRRFRYYLATKRDLEQMRWIAMECLKRAAGGWLDAETTDYLTAALGWAAHIRYFDDQDYMNCSQADIKLTGNSAMFNVLTFNWGRHDRTS